MTAQTEVLNSPAQLLISPVVTRNLLIRLTSEETNYDEIYSLTDPEILPLALKTAGIFQNALVPAENNSLRFDVNTALDVVKQNPELSVISYTDITKTTSSSQTSVMVDLVVETIKTVLGIALAPVPLAKLSAAIESAYTDLHKEEGNAWIFWEKKQEKKTTYQYNITFAVQAGPTGALLMTCPMGLTIDVDKEYERVLFITLKDTESYSTRIQALNTAQLAKPGSRTAEADAVLNVLLQNGPRKVE
ncbi:cytolytic delta-endotoxin (insecticidal protein) [unidentified bacterial endosymbiont]|jgi:Bacillus thuringiensis toxin|uniref:cytolytic delta-endotoxin (insecticidal protein) n=1 Tax=unidentified bacterial endosymbiont TaxID=2355 RepID=UPI0020A1F35A|nr:cytolytic delta-endotoxin (insecticidal protein) [unidentified bacterial endosymbiont]